MRDLPGLPDPEVLFQREQAIGQPRGACQDGRTTPRELAARASAARAAGSCPGRCRRDGPGPGGDPAVRAAFLLANDLAVLLLREHLADVLGVDPLSGEGMARWAREVLAIYAAGLLARERAAMSMLPRPGRRGRPDRDPFSQAGGGQGDDDGVPQPGG